MNHSNMSMRTGMIGTTATITKGRRQSRILILTVTCRRAIAMRIIPTCITAIRTIDATLHLNRR